MNEQTILQKVKQSQTDGNALAEELRAAFGADALAKGIHQVEETPILCAGTGRWPTNRWQLR